MREFLVRVVLDRVLPPSRPDEDFFAAGPPRTPAPLRPAPLRRRTPGPTRSLDARRTVR